MESSSKKLKLFITANHHHGGIGTYLPQEIVFDILSRLPAKPLCRFKCVSTLWNSIISDPQFINLHFDLSRSRPPTLLVCVYEERSTGHVTFCSTSGDFPSLDRQRQQLLNDQDRQLQQQQEPQFFAAEAPPQRPYMGHCISPSIGGLVSICFDNAKIGIYNPSTRESITDIDILRARDWIFAAGFLGFDPIGRTHKILGAWSSYSSETSCTRRRFCVLNLDSPKEWRDVGWDLPVPSLRSKTKAIWPRLSHEILGGV